MASETTYQLVRAKPAIRTDRSGLEKPHVFAGMSRTFCGRDTDDHWLDLGLHPKSQILNDRGCCERCKRSLINRDGGALPANSAATA
jgi:hypothetical protein